MDFKMSKNIGYQVEDIEKAKHFYESVMGLQESEDSNVKEIEYRTKHNSIFLMPGSENLGPIMEVVVSDLEAAKKYLVGNGCEIVRWHGKGKDCYVKDPFGMIFNVWEE